MRRRGRRLTRREREARSRRIRRRMLAAGLVLLMMSAAMAAPLRGYVAKAAQTGISGVQAVFTDAAETQREILLPEKTVFLQQLAVFDSGERAQQEQLRLAGEGVPCIIWQGERMRLVCAAAYRRDALTGAYLKNRETYVVSDVLEETRLRVSGRKDEAEQAAGLLLLPDELLDALIDSDEPIDAISKRAKQNAQAALDANPEHALYKQLAQSLINWCALIDGYRPSVDTEQLRGYAAAAMYLLCRELRMALCQQVS